MAHRSYYKLTNEQLLYLNKIKTGDKIKFRAEKQRYTVTGRNDKFIILTKPFNLKRTFLYTIIDIEAGSRGADNYYTKFDYSDPVEIEMALEELLTSELEVSRRNVIELDIEIEDCRQSEK